MIESSEQFLESLGKGQIEHCESWLNYIIKTYGFELILKDLLDSENQDLIDNLEFILTYELLAAGFDPKSLVSIQMLSRAMEKPIDKYFDMGLQTILNAAKKAICLRQDSFELVYSGQKELKKIVQYKKSIQQHMVRAEELHAKRTEHLILMEDSSLSELMLVLKKREKTLKKFFELRNVCKAYLEKYRGLLLQDPSLEQVALSLIQAFSQNLTMDLVDNFEQSQLVLTFLGELGKLSLISWEKEVLTPILGSTFWSQVFKVSDLLTLGLLGSLSKKITNEPAATPIQDKTPKAIKNEESQKDSKGSFLSNGTINTLTFGLTGWLLSAKQQSKELEEEHSDEKHVI